MKIQFTKRTFLTAAILFMVCITVFIVKYGTASAQVYGADDPLVSKSYVDGLYNELKAMMGNSSGAEGGTVSMDYEELITDIIARMEYLYGNSFTSSNKYVPLQMEANQIIIGDEGTEIILRSGSATGYTEAENGLVDITLGTEIMTGDPVTANHMLIVPKGDGRGMKAGSMIYLMVKGGFNIY